MYRGYTGISVANVVLGFSGDKVMLLTHEEVKVLLEEIHEREGAGEYDGAECVDGLEEEDGEEYVYGYQGCRMD